MDSSLSFPTSNIVTAWLFNPYKRQKQLLGQQNHLHNAYLTQKKYYIATTVLVFVYYTSCKSSVPTCYFFRGGFIRATTVIQSKLSEKFYWWQVSHHKESGECWIEDKCNSFGVTTRQTEQIVGSWWRRCRFYQNNNSKQFLTVVVTNILDIF